MNYVGPPLTSTLLSNKKTSKEEKLDEVRRAIALLLEKGDINQTAQITGLYLQEFPDRSAPRFEELSDFCDDIISPAILDLFNWQEASGVSLLNPEIQLEDPNLPVYCNSAKAEAKGRVWGLSRPVKYDELSWLLPSTA